MPLPFDDSLEPQGPGWKYRALAVLIALGIAAAACLLGQAVVEFALVACRAVR